MDVQDTNGVHDLWWFMNLWLISAQVTTASKEPELTELPEARGTAKGLVAARPVGPRWRSTGPTRGVETILWHPLNKTVHNLYICSGFFHQLSFLVIAKAPKKPFAMSTPLVFRKAPQLVAAPEGEFQGKVPKGSWSFHWFLFYAKIRAVGIHHLSLLRTIHTPYTGMVWSCRQNSKAGIIIDCQLQWYDCVCNGESPVQVRNCESVFGMFMIIDYFNNLLTSGMLSNPKKPGGISDEKSI